MFIYSYVSFQTFLGYASLRGYLAVVEFLLDQEFIDLELGVRIFFKSECKTIIYEFNRMSLLFLFLFFTFLDFINLFLF